jgi:XTP/dITP diphosphohydrolase
MKLLLATKNSGKIREIAWMLGDLSLDIVRLGEFKNIEPAQETGRSFVANARIKAKTYSEQTGLLTIADDSGLQVDCLGGRPGYLSARFAGEGCSDADNVKKLLRLMRGVKAPERTARFVCVVVIAEGEKVWTASGKCEGRISYRAGGTSGFGYDPVFVPKGYSTTFARLGARTKNQISHRAQALAKARLILAEMLV